MDKDRANERLTENELNFALGIVAGKNQKEAYRAAGYKEANDNVVSVRASGIIRRPLVAAKIMELRQLAIRKSTLTLEKHCDDLLALRNRAVAKENYGAAISAEIARGKAAGLYVERLDQTITDGKKALPASVDDFV